MTLGKTIAQIRKQKQFNQAQIAEKLGVNQSLIARWESDRTRPRQKTLERLALALGVEPSVLKSTTPISYEINDPELVNLLHELPKLGPHQRNVLKLLLQDLIKLSELEAVLNKNPKAS